MASNSTRSKSKNSFNPGRRRFFKIVGSGSFALFLYGCGVTPQSLAHTPTASISSTTPSSTATSEPTSTSTPEATSTPSPTPRVYDTTEFEGIYSEKYYPDKFADTLMLGNAENGFQIPLHVGLTSDMPMKGFGLTERGNDFFTDVYIAAMWWKYTKVEGHEISKEDFVTKMKNGEIDMELYYLDEITGEKKTGRYNPLNGLSITGTFRGELPLLSTPKSTTVKSYYYLSSNRERLPILVKDMGKESYQREYQNRVVNEKSMSGERLRSEWAYMSIMSMMSIFSSLTKENFFNQDGLIRIPQNQVITEMVEGYLREDAESIKTENPYIILR